MKEERYAFKNKYIAEFPYPINSVVAVNRMYSTSYVIKKSFSDLDIEVIKWMADNLLDKYRDVFICRFKELKSFNRISEEMRLPLVSVRSLYEESMRIMKLQLSAYYSSDGFLKDEIESYYSDGHGIPTHIKSLGCSVRVYNRLIFDKMLTVNSVINKIENSPLYFISRRQFGNKSYMELLSKLDEHLKTYDYYTNTYPPALIKSLKWKRLKSQRKEFLSRM